MIDAGCTEPLMTPAAKLREDLALRVHQASARIMVENRECCARVIGVASTLHGERTLAGSGGTIGERQNHPANVLQQSIQARAPTFGPGVTP